MSNHALRCPELPSFDPFSQALSEDAFPIVREAHEKAPVFFDRKLGAFVFTKYDDIMRALRDSGTFSSSSINGALPIPPELADRVPDLRPDQYTNIMALDPPEHTARRQPLQRALTFKACDMFIPRAKQIASDLIDTFIDKGECDLANDFGYLFSGRTIAAVLGFPIEEAAKFRHWTSQRMKLFVARPLDTPGEAPRQGHNLTRDEIVKLWDSIAEANSCFRHYVVQRQSQPEDDMISAMLAMKSDKGEGLYEVGDVVRAVFTLIVGGQDTTANLIANIATQLTKNPDQQALLAGDLSLVPKVIDEGLRRQSPSVGLVRRTTCETEVRGVRIPRASIIYLSLQGGNMDAEVFEDPGRFDILRPNASKYISFGTGRHTCVGQQLARMEAEVAIDALYRRIPDLKVDLSIERQFTPIFTAPAVKSLRAFWRT